MGMTLVQKILAKHAGLSKVSPGEIVEIGVDLAMTHDALGAHTAARFRELGVDKVWDASRIVVVPDHYVPNKDVEVAKKCLNLKRFVLEQDIENYYEVGKGGIAHQVLIEKGHVLPGMTVVGTDSHTTTYGALGVFAAGIGVDEMAVVFKTGRVWERVPATLKVEVTGSLEPPLCAKDLMLLILKKVGTSGALWQTIQFGGATVSELSIAGRITLANMSVEAGATNGIIEPDTKVAEYLKSRTDKPFELVRGDDDASFERTVDIDTKELTEPMVAVPPRPSGGVPVSEVVGTRIDQAFIGSCTNGRLEDLRAAASILKGRKVDRLTKVIIIPASQEIYLEADKEGLLRIFVEAGAVVSTPTCGPCMEAHMGILGPGEVMVSTANRNFVGRAGDPTAKIFLASPVTVAASALEGEITDPRKYFGKDEG